MRPRTIEPESEVHVIVNPHSGSGRGRYLLRSFRKAARRLDLPLIEYVTQGPRDATRYARTLLGRDAVAVVWGGDGTINEVAKALVGSDVPILPCPVGTENLLAQELHMPHRPNRLAGLLRDGRVLRCDAGKVNDKTFLLIAGIGFDGEVVSRLAARRRGHISHLDYFWPIWRTFWEHDFPDLRVLVDNREVFVGRGLAFVGNIAKYATGLRICVDARFDDGQFDVVVFPCHEQYQLMLHAARTVMRVHPNAPGVVYVRARRVRVESNRPVHTQVDGDVGPMPPLDISILPGGVRLIAPPIGNNGRTPSNNVKEHASS